MGGDEFAIFLPETGKESARVLLERVCGALQTMPRFHSASVTASIGIVVDGTAQTDMDSLLKQADSQMYDVKRSRKNHVRMCQMEHGVVLPCEFPWPQPPDVEKQDSCVADRVPFESQE
jgi:PleD family two-component response regulator